MFANKSAIRFVFAFVIVCTGFVIFYLAPNIFTKTLPRGGALKTNLTTKYILTWTPFFGKIDYFRTGRLDRAFCDAPSIPPCVITSNRSLLNESELVVFHLRDIRADDLPPERPPRQRWGLLNYEAPPHTPRVPIAIKDAFNVTFTYREDSDVVLLPRLRRLDGLDQMEKPRNWWTNKTRLALWLVSNCKTPSNREGFAKELAKFIQVDVVGKCGAMSCSPKNSTKCYESASKVYFFYLAFENSICTDYVTEKFYNALKWGMVPVVLGGANYSALVPQGSYVDALSFRNVRHLADHLKQVAADSLLYNSYHAWRQKYKMFRGPIECDICQIAHKRSPLQSYEDVNDWWFRKATCKRWVRASQH